METLLAFLKALPKLVEVGERILNKLEYYTDKAIDAKFEKYKAEVSETLARIENAESKEERKKLAKELSNRTSR